MEFTTHPAQNMPILHSACIISGDGLFNPLARYLAKRLAQIGIPTARVKSIKYFWSKRSPRRMSLDLRKYMTSRLRNHPDASFIFIGYSFGAGTLPFALNLLPKRFQDRIRLAVLIAPPAKADFEFHFISWWHKASKKAKPVAPEIQTLSDQIPVLYIYGVEDYVGPRPDLAIHENLRLRPLKGGHNFNKDYSAVFDVIRAEIVERET